MHKRNYRKEYDDYHGTPEQKKRRESVEMLLGDMLLDKVK